MNQSELAKRWGKTRQYVSKLFNEDKRINFTIETMCELAHQLNRRLAIQVLEPNQVAYVMRCAVASHSSANPIVEWEEGTSFKGDLAHLPSPIEFEPSGITVPVKSSFPNELVPAVAA